jgi:flagellar assembly protein FliH
MPLLRETISFPLPLRDARALFAPLTGAGTASSAAAEQAAYERGRRDGEKALSEKLVQQRGELIELQNGVLASLQRTIPEVTRECEGALVALALEIAGKLVGDLPISSEMVEASVREALGHVEQNSNLTVLLNPMDFELLQQANAPVLLTEVGGERLKFISSPQVSRGGCLVQTHFGVIDARRETKLEALKQSLASSCH